MTVRVSKPEFNLREKITELDKPTGVKGNELLRSETAQEARNLIGAAGRKNMIINGDMRINQRATSSHTLNSGNASAYVVDRFVVQCAEGTLVASQDTDVPSGQGFVKSIKLDCTGADTSLASGFESYIQYLPEAQDLAHLAYGGSGAKTVTFSFWVKSNLTKTFGFYYYVPDASRAYQTTFAISSANKWEKKVITIVGDTTGNGFNNDNGVGAEIRIYLAAGSALDGTSNTNIWGTNTTNRIPSETSILSSTDNNFYFTGFQMEVGENATEFEHLSYGEELALCHRYFHRFTGPVGGGGGYGSAGDGAIATLANWTTGNAYGPIFLGTTMRYAPTLAGFSNINYFSAGNTHAPSSSEVTLAGTSYNRVEIRITGNSMTQGDAGWLRIDATAGYMDFDAEL